MTIPTSKQLLNQASVEEDEILSITPCESLAKNRSQDRTEFQQLMSHINTRDSLVNVTVRQFLPEKKVEWSGLQSSLRLMNSVFKPIF